jgi:hypothetical protein
MREGVDDWKINNDKMLIPILFYQRDYFRCVREMCYPRVSVGENFHSSVLDLGTKREETRTRKLKWRMASSCVNERHFVTTLLRMSGLMATKSHCEPVDNTFVIHIRSLPSISFSIPTFAPEDVYTISDVGDNITLQLFRW